MKVSVVVCRVQQRDATNRRRFAVRSQKVSTAGIYISLKRTKYQKFSFLYSVGRARQRDQECGLAKGWREDFPGFPVDFKRSRVESGQEEALALARCGGKILAASRNPSGHPAPPAAASASGKSNESKF